MATGQVKDWFKPEGINVSSGKIVGRIYFTSGWVLSPNAQLILRNLIEHYRKKLQSGSKVKLYFSGRSDVHGTTDLCQKVSEERARAVRAFVNEQLQPFSGYDSNEDGTGRAYAGNKPHEDRRVDIYEWLRDPISRKIHAKSDITEPVGIHKQKTAMDDMMPSIQRGHVKSIRAVAAWVSSITIDDSQLLYYGILGLGADKAKAIGRKPPPWWATRTSRIQGWAGKPPIVKNALLMFRDLKEFFYWGDIVGPLQRQWVNDKKSKEKRAKLEEATSYESNAGYSAKSLAEKILKETK